ncbi:hypothetical protein EJ08DRAFT_699629 [Tothia fuscella]|uniref:Uncharacterized protein n=1 Tax=Tothia fuscella TaxID=1048955 RepID=A0A9P4NLQ2_9PEZI|nr:hypothetical protein EJ08DRAFT_699629 [Tothia fuscella]
MRERIRADQAASASRPVRVNPVETSIQIKLLALVYGWKSRRRTKIYTLDSIAAEYETSIEFVVRRLLDATRTASCDSPESDKLLISLVDEYDIFSWGIDDWSHAPKSFLSLFEQDHRQLKARVILDGKNNICWAIDTENSINGTNGTVCECPNCLEEAATRDDLSTSGGHDLEANPSWSPGPPSYLGWDDFDPIDASSRQAEWTNLNQKIPFDVPLTAPNSSKRSDTKPSRSEKLELDQQNLDTNDDDFYDPSPVLNTHIQSKCLSCGPPENSELKSPEITNKMRTSYHTKRYCNHCGEVNWKEDDICCECGRAGSSSESTDSKVSRLRDEIKQMREQWQDGAIWGHTYPGSCDHLDSEPVVDEGYPGQHGDGW